MPSDSNLNIFEKLANQAAGFLREWAYEHPLDEEPAEVIEAVAASCLPDNDEEIRNVASIGGLEIDESGVPIDVLRLRLCDLLEKHLWREWDVIEGEREIMNEMEDDLD